MTKTASAKRKRAEREAIKAAESNKRAKPSHDASADGSNTPDSNDVADTATSSSGTRLPKILLEKKLFVEKSTGQDRIREAKLYDLLSSENETDRLEAAGAIISSLLDGEGVTEECLTRHLDWRLFRGLASGRAGSRLGYSVVLTEILSQLHGPPRNLCRDKYPNLTFDKVLEMLMERTRFGGNISGQEERDLYFGQLFGLECFVRAKILFLEEEGPNRWIEILRLLVKLGGKKIWLRPQCGWVVAQALAQLDRPRVEMVLQQLVELGWAKTPEGVGIWLVAFEQCPELTTGDKAKHHHPLSSRNLNDLAGILKESGQDDVEKQQKQQQQQQQQSRRGHYVKNKKANWTPQLHFVWDLIVRHFLRKGPAGVDEFRSFWKRVVDDNFFAKTATEGQKFRGFLVFQKMLQTYADIDDLLDVLFSRNLMTCLINQASQEDRFLHRAALKTLKVVEEISAAHPEATGIILDNLINNNGLYRFDVMTKSKTVDKILQHVKAETGEDVIQVLSGPVMKTSTTSKDINSVKLDLRVYIEYIFRLTTSAPEPALQELTSLAYAKPIWIPENANSLVTELSRSRLQSAFAKLSRKAEDSNYLCTAVQSINPDYIRMEGEMKKEVHAARKRLEKLMKKSASASESSTDEVKISQGLALLHAIAIFQLYNEEPDAFQLLSDLKEYQTRLQTDEEGAAEFLVEILLSLVSQQSSLLREISQRVFGYFTSRVSPKALELLLDVLSADESAKGQQSLFDVDADDMDVEDMEEDEEDESDDEAGSDAEVDSNVEFDALDAGDDEEGEENDDDEEGSGSDEEADDEEAQNLADLDDALGKILNSHRLDKDEDAESSDNDSDMSDGDMLELDGKLAEVFKQRQKAAPSKKKERKAAKESVVNFKRRVLDLLEIFVRNEAGSPTTLAILQPLLQLVRTSTIKTLSDRAFELVKDYQKRARKARSGNSGKSTEDSKLDLEEAVEVLKGVYAELKAGETKSHAKAAVPACLIAASGVFHAGKGDRAAVDAVVGDVEDASATQLEMKKAWDEWCRNQEALKKKAAGDSGKSK
ncbi:DNA polymerase phi [Colletotrichum phormii]|uniref:DNA polymerase phi n=1 Tax=Colletotrichum phormii TaxID=359342 RepID=A0AAI9ZHW9_9PEZI|nr:DNA polymerase phi [Colletotrichum phormii]KAK1623619.1 DNA polymerase phi [Colletotrichum phormii]